MSLITALWANEELPIKDGLYLSSGESVGARLDPTAANGIVLLSDFDLEVELGHDPEWVTTFDITRKLNLADKGTLCCGEGSWGSEGFFARTGSDGGLMWVMYFQESNPFTDITRTEQRATFLSTSGVRITVDIEDPRRS